jgi:hypothetical protein
MVGSLFSRPQYHRPCAVERVRPPGKAERQVACLFSSEAGGRSAALAELEHTGNLLLHTLTERFPVQDEPLTDSQRSRDPWRLRYAHALARLREAGIPTRADQESGAREYAELRARWEPRIEALAPALGLRMEEVDRAGCGKRVNTVSG